MSAVDFSLAIGALICALISWRSPRGHLWIAVGALSYAIATIAWRSGMPMAEVVTALCDASVVATIYFLAKYRWELWIGRLYLLSFGVSIFYLAGSLGLTSRLDHDLYAIALEGVNWLVLLSIGGSAALQGLGVSHVVASGPWGRVRDLVVSSWAERKRAPLSFSKAR